MRKERRERGGGGELEKVTDLQEIAFVFMPKSAAHRGHTEEMRFQDWV